MWESATLILVFKGPSNRKMVPVILFLRFLNFTSQFLKILLDNVQWISYTPTDEVV
jgi:hypothetical protein